MLSKFRRLAESHKVDEIIAAATSATREAENGGEFLKSVAEQTGIRPRVISGTEEARLIHLAASYGVNVSGDTAVVIDIGGGSVEITRGVGANVELARSFKLGVIRLTERFVKSDPLEPRDERKLLRHIDAEIGDYLDEIAAAGFDRVIGTSGTILSLGAIASAAEGRPAGRAAAQSARLGQTASPHTQGARRARSREAAPRARTRAAARRSRRGRRGAARRDRPPARRDRRSRCAICRCARGSSSITSRATASRSCRPIAIPTSGGAASSSSPSAATTGPSTRSRSRGSSVALFDQTRAIHGLTDREREWLEYAALLHDIGVHISYESHHKHSYYLIKNGDLRGFEPDEIETIALVARYHRQATPKKRHEGFGDFGRKRRQTIRTLAAILRLAESLDRSHSQTVAGVELHDRGDDGLLQIRIDGRRGARGLGGRPARGAVRAPDRQAASSRGQWTNSC